MTSAVGYNLVIAPAGRAAKGEPGIAHRPAPRVPGTSRVRIGAMVGARPARLPREVAPRCNPLAATESRLAVAGGILYGARVGSQKRIAASCAAIVVIPPPRPMLQCGGNRRPLGTRGNSLGVSRPQLSNRKRRIKRAQT